jgi:CHAT domain-containing protein
MGHSELMRYVREAFRDMDKGLEHLSIEQLAEMANSRNPGAAGQDVVRHLAACDLCEERLLELELFLADCKGPAREELSKDVDREWRQLRRRIRWHNTMTAIATWGRIAHLSPRWAGGAAGIVLATGLAWFGTKMLTPSPSNLLAQAYYDQRTIEYRVAGAQYAPMRVERGGSSTFSMPEPLLKAAARIAAEMKASPDNPEVLRLEGEAEMIERQAAAAVRTLQKALDFSPQDARILADLGSAYALRGDLERQPADYPNALEYLSRSLHIQPQAPEIIFNRALVLERMQLKDQAVLEWEHYLKIDGKSDWAKEARKHLAELKAAMKSREDALRRIVDNPDKFLALAASNSVDAEAYLRDIAVTKWLPRAGSDARIKEATVRLAQILKDRHGDSWLSEMVGGLDATLGLQQLAAARVGNQTAHADAAIAAAREAQQSFQRSGSKPGVLWARFEEVVGVRGQLRSEECVPMAEALIRELDAHPSYIWLRAQARVECTYCAMRAGRLNDAGPSLHEGIEISRAAGFGDVALRAGAGYLDSIGYIGLPSEIFGNADEFLRTFWNGTYSPARFQQFAEILRDITSRSEQKYAAWFLARSAAWAADGTLNPRVEAPAHANLAVAAQAVGEDNEARGNLEIADKLYIGLPTGYRLRPQAFLAEVELKRQDVDAALRRLEKIRAALGPSPPTNGASQYYQVLGEAYRRKGSLPNAIDAFRESIDFGKRTIVSLASEREKAGALKIIENSYRGLVASTLATSADSAEGLRIWQSFRALDAVGTAGQIQPADVPILSFLELPDGLVSWMSRKDRVLLHRLGVSKAALATAVGRFRRECSDPSIGWRVLSEDAKRLYQWMVGPFATQFTDEDRELIFELDGVFAGVPVQALMSPDGHYLGDRFSVLVSSGYTTTPKPTPPGRISSVLVVANPAVTGDSRARFPTLPDSLKEAEIVRANFAGTTVLEGHDATVDALIASLPRAEIFHFAGHGYSDSENGALLFAPKNPKSADYVLLRSADLARQDWSKCRLAVLSACAAASGEIQGPHNPDSLVRALTRAGAPRVAASLWNVESRATAELMGAFYGTMASGTTPTVALRTAQQRVRQRPEWSHPYYWAGFQLFGTT